MSFLDRVRECNTFELSRFRPFCIEGHHIGWLKAPFVHRLREYPDVFQVKEEEVSLRPRLADLETRSSAVAEVLRDLSERGVIAGWRDETYPVSRGWHTTPLLHMERAAIPYFGVRAYGIHVNAFVMDQGCIKMWVARRSLQKPTFPGMLDNMVAGGQPIGIGLRENLIKECKEEADIPAELSQQADPVGVISYVVETTEGMKPDIQFVYDLELRATFEPTNTDGEVEEFYLWPIEKVMDVVSQTPEFKFNCSLVIIHFLIRRGLISPEDPDYLDIVLGLHAHGEQIWRPRR
jgi:isopentenyldiphosphate isomerase